MNNFSVKINYDQHLDQYLHLKYDKSSLKIYILYVNVVIKLSIYLI